MIYTLLQAAPAAPATGGGSMSSSLIFFVALFAIMYFLMIRPGKSVRKRRKRCWIASR